MVENFKLKEIPSLNPKTSEFRLFWKEQKRRIIEGYWVANVWMPGILYFYINFWHIKIKASRNSKTEKVGKPFLRDLEWDKSYLYVVGRGFSGFKDDDEVTCNLAVKGMVKRHGEFTKDTIPEDFEEEFLTVNCFKPDGTVKKFIDPLTYLNSFHAKQKGKALYENQAKNVFDLECRGSGKDLHEDTLLHYIDGSKRKIKDVKVGDSIFGGNGLPTKVIQRVDYTDQMQYKVTSAKGRTVVCGGGHLWTVYFKGKKVTLSLDTIKILYKEEKVELPINEHCIPSKEKIVNIEPIGVYPSVCIGVDNEDKLFLVNDHVVTHNSFFISCAIGHNFLTDGATDYDDYLKAIEEGSPLLSETLVGATDASYSGDLLKKVMLGFKYLEGSYGKYPSPLSKKYTGTITKTGSVLVQNYKKKVNGIWKTYGSGSQLHHRSFADDPLAGNGTRPNLTVLEEFGFFKGAKATLDAMKQTTLNGSTKFGTIWVQGTGGESNRDIVDEIKDIYFNPDAYDIVAFINEKGGSRGYFVPYHKGMNEYKDPLTGKTDIVKAKKKVEMIREPLKALPSMDSYNREIQNNPETPEEAFLLKGGNFFPRLDLEEQLNYVLNSTDPMVKGHIGSLVLDPTASNGVRFVKDMTNTLKLATYPVKEGEPQIGAVHIIEHPMQGKIPYGMYIAGTDPYDHDSASNSTSLGSTFIYKIGDFREGGMKDIVVAEYTGRPENAETHHETVRRLLMYYQAEDLFENEKITLKSHFQQQNSLYLLARQPDILKATINTTVNRGYGIHMTKMIKDEGLLYLRDWLNEDRGEGLKNLHYIFFPALLKELIAYIDGGNFDRVIAMILVIIQRLNHYRSMKKKEEQTEEPFNGFFNRRLY